MQIYLYIVENELETFHYYFTYEISPKDIIVLAKNAFQDKVSLVDVFPEPNIKKGHLTQPLRVVTKIGKEMYLPEGLNVEIITKYRALFQCGDDKLL